MDSIVIKIPTCLSSACQVMVSGQPNAVHLVTVFWKEHSNHSSYLLNFLRPFHCWEFLTQN